jgi:hypothetical protein
LPFKLGLFDDSFDIQEHCDAVKNMVEGQNLKLVLDATFYVPLHAAALVLETERRTTLKEKCSYECEKRGLKKYQTPSRIEKYEIAKAIGIQVPDYSTFKSGGSLEYHRISKILNELGYHKKTSHR